MGKKRNEAWETLPELPEFIDYKAVQHNRDKQGAGSPAGAGVWPVGRSEGLPEASAGANREQPVKDAVEASEALRGSETNVLPTSESVDDINVGSAADGDRQDRRHTNPRYKAQQTEVGDLLDSGHGYTVQKLGSQFQRVLSCQRCAGVIPVDIDPALWPCECGSPADDPDRSWCRCAGCTGLRQALKSGYVGRGRPPEYCSARCRMDAKNLRKKQVRGTAVDAPKPVRGWVTVGSGLDDREGVRVPADHPLAAVLNLI